MEEDTVNLGRTSDKTTLYHVGSWNWVGYTKAQIHNISCLLQFCVFQCSVTVVECVLVYFYVLLCIIVWCIVVQCSFM